MLQKPKQPQESLSFEQLLGWFGRFTPQFKFKLMSVKRQLKMNEFDLFIRETLTVFRSLLIELGQTPKGPSRAKAVYQMLDKEYQASPPLGISCSKECAACCKSFPKHITDDEADLLTSLIESKAVEFDQVALMTQINDLSSNDPQIRSQGERSPCLFLDHQNNCRIYENRPSICRKYHVVSPKEFCSMEGEAVTPRIDLMPEMIVSAAISLPDNGIDLMPNQLYKRLNRENKFDSESLNKKSSV